MATEIYKGRKIVIVRRRTRDGAEYVARLNGVETYTCPSYRDPAGLAELVRNEIDRIGEEIDGGSWGIEWYAPGTAELCAEGIHAQRPGGPCKHPSCVERNAGETSPCPKCGTEVTRYQPIGLPDSWWITAHYAPQGRRKTRLLCSESDGPDRGPRANYLADRKVR